LEGLEETLREYAFIVLSQKLKPSQGIEEAWVRDVRVRGEARGVVELEVVIAGRHGSLEVSESRIVKVAVHAAMCPSCMRKASKTGYTAVIQIRPVIGEFTGEVRRRLERILAKLEARVRSSIISVEEVRNGVDILVEDQNVARIIASKLRSSFGGSVVETFKVTGVKPGGGRKGILTIAVRLLNVEPGYIIAYSGAPHIVLGGGPQGLQLLNMETGDVVGVGYDDLGKALVLDANSYVGVKLKRLSLDRVEGSQAVFRDIAGGGELQVKLEDVIVLRGGLVPGGVYLAYLLGRKAYILGEARVE